jgi:DNA-binding NtrC family response regulator
MPPTPFQSSRSSWSNPDQQLPGIAGRQVLAVGSDPSVLAYVHEVLAKDGLSVTSLSKDQATIRLQKGLNPNIMLIQAVGPASLELLTVFRELRPSVPVVLFHCFHDSRFVVNAMKMGAADCIQLPFVVDALIPAVRRHLALVEGEADSEPVFEKRLQGDASFVCASRCMNEIRGQCAILARVDLPVLVLGESGTGKEIITQYIHEMSPRAHRTFLKVNCAAMPADLLESELFGYEQGAFTGAVRSKPGKFEICNMGTLLLDEIGEMPPQLQAKLLQVLQDGTFSRLGGRNSIKVDVRVIAATNIDMKAAIAARTFREDLYYRLNGISICIPPLRERKEEIPVMIRHFMSKLAGKYARQPLTMSEQLLQACMAHNWPGNLREMENFVKRYLVLGTEAPMLAELQNSRGIHSVAAQARLSVEAGGGLKRVARNAMGEAETEAMAEALSRSNWNRKQAAAELGISYKALLYKIRQYGLAPDAVSSFRTNIAGD